MSNKEKYEVALTRIRGGEPIKNMITALYKNWRHYKKQCNEEQRYEIRAARLEYLASRGNKTKRGYKRVVFIVCEEREKDIQNHCKALKIPVSRFMNKLLAAALKKDIT